MSRSGRHFLPLSVQEYETAVYASMKEVTAYCGEDFDANDPSRILRVVRDFMKLFEKAMADIKARPSSLCCRQQRAAHSFRAYVTVGC